MKKIMMKKWLISMVILFSVLMRPMVARADIGPKPSVTITFIGLEKEEYYVTLLANVESTGPWSVGNPYYDYMGDEAVFDKFAAYEDEFFFLSYMEDCSEDDTFEWNYYPPSEFKVLIYFPETDSFIISDEVYERYAFDSYFTVSAENLEDGIQADKTYDFTMELISLIVRVIITIAIELGIAWLFFYREKRALRIILITNVFTQIVLNVLLNIINYKSGQYAFVFHYVWMEIVVFAIEGIIYQRTMGLDNKETGKKRHPYRYAAIANLASLIIGIWLAKVIPGIF